MLFESTETMRDQGSNYILQGRAKNVPLLKFPAKAATWKTDQTMHNQSASMENLRTEFTQPSPICLLEPVDKFLIFGIELSVIPE